jgi:hypothetical protein
MKEKIKALIIVVALFASSQLALRYPKETCSFLEHVAFVLVLEILVSFVTLKKHPDD